MLEVVRKVGINFEVSTCAVVRVLLTKCSKVHGSISFSNAKTKRKEEARQCPYSRGGRKGTRTSSTRFSMTPRPPPETR